MKEETSKKEKKKQRETWELQETSLAFLADSSLNIMAVFVLRGPKLPLNDRDAHVSFCEGTHGHRCDVPVCQHTVQILTRAEDSALAIAKCSLLVLTVLQLCFRARYTCAGPFEHKWHGESPCATANGHPVLWSFTQTFKQFKGHLRGSTGIMIW